MKTFVHIFRVIGLLIISSAVFSQSWKEIPNSKIFIPKSRTKKISKQSEATFIYQFNIKNGKLQDLIFNLENFECKICESENLDLVSDDNNNKPLMPNDYYIYPCSIKDKKVIAKSLPDGEYSIFVEKINKGKCKFGVTVYAKKYEKNTSFELLLFGAATNSDNSQYLYWTTENENGVERYDIEKKVNGRWEFVGAHESKNISSGKINYTMPIKHDFGVNQYRIKQVYSEDHYSYSQILDLLWNGQQILFDIFPNPTNSQELYLSLNILQKQNLNLSIINEKGVEIFNKNIIKEKGKFISTVQLENILKSGSYTINGTIENKTYSKKIVIM